VGVGGVGGVYVFVSTSVSDISNFVWFVIRR